MNILKKQICFVQTELRKELFIKINNRGALNKPRGGLWSSTYTSGEEYLSEWHEFCALEYWDGLANKDRGVIFDFDQEARIYIIDSYDDFYRLFKLFNIAEGPWTNRLINFEELSKYWDIIHLTTKGQCETRLTHPYNLYGWDIECCLIMNFDIVKIDKYIDISVYLKTEAT